MDWPDLTWNTKYQQIHILQKYINHLELKLNGLAWLDFWEKKAILTSRSNLHSHLRMVTDLFMNQSTRESKALSSTGGHGHGHIDIIARRSSPKGQTKLFHVKFFTLGGWGTGVGLASTINKSF